MRLFLILELFHKMIPIIWEYKRLHGNITMYGGVKQDPSGVNKICDTLKSMGIK